MFSWERESHYASLVYHFLRIYFSLSISLLQEWMGNGHKFPKKNLLKFKT